MHPLTDFPSLFGAEFSSVNKVRQFWQIQAAPLSFPSELWHHETAFSPYSCHSPAKPPFCFRSPARAAVYSARDHCSPAGRARASAASVHVKIHLLLENKFYCSENNPKPPHSQHTHPPALLRVWSWAASATLGDTCGTRRGPGGKWRW